MRPGTAPAVAGQTAMSGAGAILTRLAGLLQGMPEWVISSAIFVAAFVGAVLVHAVVYRVAGRLAASRDLFWRALVSRTRRPMRYAIVAAAVSAASSAAPLAPAAIALVQRLLLVGIIVAVSWMAQTLVHVWMTVYLRRFKLDAENNLFARKHVTQTRILERVARVLVLVIGIAAALMTFPGVRQYGVSLLASAGAAGIVVGLALQPVLKNLFAGIQLAITQPIRIDDVVVVEGEWGHVEEITATYVVVRIWDLRRLILPLSYFIEQPFQNWTREGASLIGAVVIYLDYTVPVAAVRAKVEEIVRASPLWDGNAVGLQVTDFRERVMEVRILAGARNSGDAFNLRCIVREKLVAYLLEAYPDCLPRTRAEVSAPAPTGSQDACEPAIEPRP